jgi:F-type H+-transporting ATPase subunit alpha
MAGKMGKDQLDLKTIIGASFRVMDEVLEQHRSNIRLELYGTVSFVGPGILQVDGLEGVQYEEIILFAGDRPGMALDLDETETGVVLLDESEGLAAGNEAYRTQRVMEVPVGEEILARVVDGRGRPLDGKAPLRTTERRAIEQPAPRIMDRSPVSVPLQTGLKVVDALIPIGRGQRELILGDRQTGKSAIAVDTIINQRDSDVICIYCAVGKRVAAVAKVISDLKKFDAMDYSTVVVATEEDPPGLQFVAPFAAMTVGEHFMHQGRDVLLVLDDLTRHARAYRELSLLLRRPPGREAYPGDIFYLHSRLLERSTHLNEKLGGGSLTALPIIETEAQNISAYIPTNLISITDGQIYLSPRLFSKGNLPAVDVGKSVSRVGGKTQLSAYREVAGDLRLSYSQFEELEAFSRFGTRMDEDTRQTLDRGRRVREVLKQPQYTPLPVAEQIAALVAVNEGVLDNISIEDIADAEKSIRQAIKEDQADLCKKITNGNNLEQKDIDTIRQTAENALQDKDINRSDANKSGKDEEPQ